MAAGIDAGAGRAEHPADHGQRQLVVHGYLGRFAGGIWTPLICAETPGQRGSVDLVETHLPFVVAWPRRTAAGVKVERPQQREDERPYVGEDRRTLGRQGRVVHVSAGCSPPRHGGGDRLVRAGAQPYLGARTHQGPATR
jgi:hypothetical protein